MRTRLATLLFTLAAVYATVAAQNPAQPAPQPIRERDPLTPAPARRPGEGAGPFKTLVLRGAILIDGSGAPPVGPVDIVINTDNALTVKERERGNRNEVVAPRIVNFQRAGAGWGKGPVYNTYGFGNIHEMELLQEAGFHPLEVIQAATYNPATTLAESWGTPLDRGHVRAGLLADLVVVDQNPLKNLKVLYGSGALRLNDQTRKPEWIGGVKYTIKDGVVYDAKKLLADVGAMVEKQKQSRGTTTSAASR
jgi:hypothetical protein